MSLNNNDKTVADPAVAAENNDNNRSIDLVSSVVSRYNLVGNSSSSSSGGEAGIQRLLWIGTKHPNAAVQAACFRAISTTCLRHGNVQRYKEVFGSSQGKAPLSIPQQDGDASSNNINNNAYNANWVAEQEALYRQGRDVLQHRLQAAQSQLHKEAIRTAYMALAEHDRKAGELVEAFHSLLRAKDYCTSRHQTTTISLQIVEVCLLLKNYAAAGDYIQKLEHTIFPTSSSSTTSATTSRGGTASDVTAASSTVAAPTTAVVTTGDAAAEVVKQKIQTAAALKHLASGEYDIAAQKLAAAAISAASISSSPSQPLLLSLSQPQVSSMSSGASPGQERIVPPAVMAAAGVATSSASSAALATGALMTVLAPEDVATYAAFLTLCCGSTSDMIALAEHPEALELVPALREALLQFAVHFNYGLCWKLLQDDSNCFEQLQYDLYMAPHVETLQQMIRERSIAEYWKAYQRVELVDMANDLRGIVSGVPVLKELLVQLMLRHALDEDGTTRLNLTSLHRDEPAQPRLEQTSDKLRLVTQHVLNDVHAMTIRLACLEHDLQVRGGTGSGGGDGGGGGGGRRTRRGARGGGGGAIVKLDDSDDEEDHDAHMVDAGDMNPEDLY